MNDEASTVSEYQSIMRKVTKSLVSLMSVTRIVTADSLGIGLGRRLARARAGTGRVRGSIEMGEEEGSVRDKR
jgi:hypothetical protein